MTNLNIFESVFKAADKATFAYRPVEIGTALLVTDLAPEESESLLGQVRTFLSAIDRGRIEWPVLTGGDFGNVQGLLDQIERHRPDLVVTYRHLQSDAWQWPFSLGEYLDVLTQATTAPVLVLPHPDASHALPHSVRNTDRVMAITDHLTGDDRLVNTALAFTGEGGACWLTHVEGAPAFERLMDAISKIPEIETEVARAAIERQLLKEPHDFIRTCRGVIEAEKLPVRIEEIVTMGRRLAEYRELIESHQVDLLVFHTKDEDQLAMHGLAYPLAVELRQIPLLML